MSSLALGDIVYLDCTESDGEGYSAVGYLTSIKDQVVKLSTYFSKIGNPSKNPGIFRRLVEGVRGYSLEHFRTYEVLGKR